MIAGLAAVVAVALAWTQDADSTSSLAEARDDASRRAGAAPPQLRAPALRSAGTRSAEVWRDSPVGEGGGSPPPLPSASAQAEAQRRWHDDVQQRLVACMPPWTEAGEPRSVRIYFPPPVEAPGYDEPVRLQVGTVEPLEANVTVPADVRGCLDQLLETELELPAGSEAADGHQEIIPVMWG